MDELADKGAEFTGPVQDFGFGPAANLKVPDAGEILLSRGDLTVSCFDVVALGAPCSFLPVAAMTKA
jgi:hypothetical protein